MFSANGPSELAKPNDPIKYASLRWRIAAAVIDILILSLVEILATGPFFFLVGFVMTPRQDLSNLPIFPLILACYLVFFATCIFPWIYFALFESSSLGGSPGKFLLGLRVLDAKSRRFSFWGSTIKLILQNFLVWLLWWISVYVLALALSNYFPFGFQLIFVGEKGYKTLAETSIYVLTIFFLYSFVISGNKRQSLIDIIMKRYVLQGEIPQRNFFKILASVSAPVSQSNFKSLLRRLTVGCALGSILLCIIFSSWEISRLIQSHLKVEQAISSEFQGKFNFESLHRNFSDTDKLASELSLIYESPIFDFEKGTMTWCKRMLALNQENRDAIESLIANQVALGQKEDVVQSYSYLIQLDYGCTKQFWNRISTDELDRDFFLRAAAKCKMEQWESAIEDLSQAIYLNPFEKDYFKARSECYKHLQKIQECSLDQQTWKALQESPEFLGAVAAIFQDFDIDDEKTSSQIQVGLESAKLTSEISIQYHLAKAIFLKRLSLQDWHKNYDLASNEIQLCLDANSKRPIKNLLRSAQLYRFKAKLDEFQDRELSDWQELLKQIDQELTCRSKSPTNRIVVSSAQPKISNLSAGKLLDLNGEKNLALTNCVSICLRNEDYKQALFYQEQVLTLDTSAESVKQSIAIAKVANEPERMRRFEELLKQLKASPLPPE